MGHLIVTLVMLTNFEGICTEARMLASLMTRLTVVLSCSYVF